MQNERKFGVLGYLWVSLGATGCLGRREEVWGEGGRSSLKEGPGERKATVMREEEEASTAWEPTLWACEITNQSIGKAELSKMEQ